MAAGHATGTAGEGETLINLIQTAIVSLILISTRMLPLASTALQEASLPRAIAARALPTAPETGTD